MMVSSARAAVSGVINVVRDTISRSGTNVKDVCTAINKCSSNKAQRYVLCSVDSIFDGLNLDPEPSSEGSGDKKVLARVLCKLPRAVYMPRTPDITRPGPDLGSILDHELNSWDSSDTTLQDYAVIVQELGDTAEFVSEHSLDSFFGPLRPSAISLLERYKHELLQESKRGDLKKLTHATQLLQVMKLHSMDTDELVEHITGIIQKTPMILKQCNISTLETIAKMKLPSELRDKFDDYLRMSTTRYMGFKEWSEYFWMVARNSDNRNTIDCFLHSYKILARNMRREGGDDLDTVKSISCASIMNVVHGITTLKNRLRTSDVVYKDSMGLLESIWPLIEERKQQFQNSEFIDIAECYFENHRVVNPQMRHGSRNCLDVLMNEFVRRADQFLLRDWVSAFEVLDCARDAMVINVMQKPTNYYIKVTAVQTAWIEDLANELKGMPLEEIAENIYSLSLPQCSNLCKHLVAAGCYDDPISAALERRCLAILTDLKYHNTRHVMDFYFVQLQMVLPQQSALKTALENNKPLREMLVQMSCNSLLRLLRLAHHCNPADSRLLLHKLAEKIEANVLKLTPQQCVTVLRYASRLKDCNLTNAVIAVATPPLLSSDESHKGFCKMLDLSKFALAMPKSDFADTTPAGILNQLIVDRAPVHVHHLGLQHLDILLQNLNRAGGYPSELMESVLGHAMEIDLSSVTSTQLSSMLQALSNLGIRHEYLLERLEDAILMSLIDEDGSVAAEVLTSAATALAHLGLKTARLNELFEHILASSPVAIAKWDYSSLSLPVRVGLLHAIALFGTVNEHLETTFSALVEECGSATRKVGDAVSFVTLDGEAYRKLYDTYISLLVAGSGSSGSKLVKSDFLLEHLPCYHWFRYQDNLQSEFKASPHYTQLKSALRQLGLEDADSRITEAYFTHMVLDSPDCTSVLGSPKILYCIPAKDELRWWTPKGDSTHNSTINRIESYKHAMGQSSRVIDHLQRSGWTVLPIFLREWDTLSADKRLHHLSKVLKLNKERLEH
ncbi:uncharacterized protein BXIN_2824 [Babesia sp. Xinjiang]|uniref:uncharacterized protein n=1 Tax=Babesia sp. Xinjiang TaxID=462227 RepID=UPI000A23B789|nr:uncharacterized protein BXIN_2824 [Babesia sp. Xinjiang]ORM41752.1 hypothetical protein BXIN_2824 [Babesia sp. Xinjiang]